MESHIFIVEKHPYMLTAVSPMCGVSTSLPEVQFFQESWLCRMGVLPEARLKAYGQSAS